MFLINVDLVVFLMLFNGEVSQCQRRIQKGIEVTADKPYAVYFVKAAMSKKKYDTWLCGGAIIGSMFVITSAACLNDVDFMYVVAGYKIYVNDENLNVDPCTKEKKKKVIFTCSPRSYDFQYDTLQKWAHIDVGVARVESPFDFEDKTYLTLCSYIPKIIKVNYDAKYQEPGTDAMVLGWGHPGTYRKESDKINWNRHVLHYASVMIIDKEKCKKGYTDFASMSQVIDEYMLCSEGSGAIDDTGKIEYNYPEGCEYIQRQGQTSLKFPDHGALCDENEGAIKDDVSLYHNDETRKFNAKLKTHNISTIDTKNETQAFTKTPFAEEEDIDPEMRTVDNETIPNTRRQGICQNDHGGPLVTWVGTHEVLIGVASVYKVTLDYACVGPFLYTSTMCNAAFLDCIVNHHDHEAWPYVKNTDDQNYQPRRSLCKVSPTDKGHPMVEKYITWVNHPDGPADNEKHIKRNPNSASNIGPDGKKHAYEKNKYKDPETTTTTEQNERYTTDYAYTVNERSTLSDKYTVTEQYQEYMRQTLKEQEYAVYERHTVSPHGLTERLQVTEGDTTRHTTNNKDTVDDKYAAGERRDNEMVINIEQGDYPQFIIRPQRPIQI